MSDRDCYCGHAEHQHTTAHKADGTTTGMACLACFDAWQKDGKKKGGLCFDRSFMGSSWDLSMKLQELWRAIGAHDKEFAEKNISIITK